ncbi:MAG: ABC transporter six-transmembrane domain-containing protein [Pseudomonadota bacterium]
MFADKKLSLTTIVRAFWLQVSVTWTLTLLETLILVTLPLLIGRSIDGLLNDTWGPFYWLASAILILLLTSVGRRLYDTRAYGRMRVELGVAVANKAEMGQVSTTNARLNMSRELIGFLETEAPIVIMALLQVIVSLAVLFSFHGLLAATAGGATLAALIIYGLSSKRFFRLNGDLNAQSEQQVAALESRLKDAIGAHLMALRRHEIRLSDTEAIVYGLIFAVLLSMLGTNLWFAATQLAATPGQIFSIVTYSYEFIESAVMLPAALQSLTRISEITQRINRLSDSPLEEEVP